MTDAYTTGQPPAPQPTADMPPAPAYQPATPPQNTMPATPVYGAPNTRPDTGQTIPAYAPPSTPQYRQSQPAPQYGYAQQQYTPQYRQSQPAPQYGYAQQQYTPQQQTNTLPWSGLGIAGFVCSVVSFFFLGIILGPLGLVLSILGYRQTSQGTHRGRGLALAGIIIGGICTALAVIGIIAGFSAITMFV